MKLAYNNNGTIGIFGENIEVENYVEITEDIKEYILTNNVKLNLDKIKNGCFVDSKNYFLINDFIEIKPKTDIELLKEKTEILEKENADLLKDSALKDIRIETVENDMADLIKEMAGGM